jgi:hypothetical protein
MSRRGKGPKRPTAFGVAATVTLRSSRNATHFWIMLWLISGSADHGMIPGWGPSQIRVRAAFGDDPIGRVVLLRPVRIRCSAVRILSAQPATAVSPGVFRHSKKCRHSQGLAANRRVSGKENPTFSTGGGPFHDRSLIREFSISEIRQAVSPETSCVLAETGSGCGNMRPTKPSRYLSGIRSLSWCGNQAVATL